jgi:hypothetical protein
LGSLASVGRLDVALEEASGFVPDSDTLVLQTESAAFVHGGIRSVPGFSDLLSLVQVSDTLAPVLSDGHGGRCGWWDGGGGWWDGGGGRVGGRWGGSRGSAWLDGNGNSGWASGGSATSGRGNRRSGGGWFSVWWLSSWAVGNLWWRGVGLSAARDALTLSVKSVQLLREVDVQTFILWTTALDNWATVNIETVLALDLGATLVAFNFDIDATQNGATASVGGFLDSLAL